MDYFFAVAWALLAIGLAVAIAVTGDFSAAPYGLAAMGFSLLHEILAELKRRR